MARRSGAGASVSSGASYQARIGAFAIAATLCDHPALFCGSQKIKSISFETTEEVDDINIETTDGNHIYIQAKSSIDFSTNIESEFASAFSQFLRQYVKTGQKSSFRLIAGRQSSRRVTENARAALQAFQLGTEEQFRRDQNQSTVEALDSMISLLLSLQKKLGIREDRNLAVETLMRTSIWPFDIENDEPNVQAIILFLASRNYESPELLWDKIISDCVSFSKRRNSISLEKLFELYGRFKIQNTVSNEQRNKEIFNLTVASQFSVGRDVLLCRIPKNDKVPEGLAILELYRFDDDCNRRIQFTESEAILAGGFRVPVFRRTSTYQGMMRLLESDPTLIETDEELKLLPINSDEDFESGLCAEAHRTKLESARLKNKRPLHCVRCGQAVSSNAAPIVELEHGEELIVGLCHADCLGPTYRVIGEIQGAFFEQHPELQNFDVEAWFKAVQGGQITFRNAAHKGVTKSLLIWNGRRNRTLESKFVIAAQLENGEQHIVTERGRVTRYTKDEAEASVTRMVEAHSGAAKAGNPFYVTSETRSFGNRSALTELYGATERFLAIKSFDVIPYETRFSAGEDANAKWYAPVMFLRDRRTSEPVNLFGSTAILTDPLHLKNFIANWKEAGIEIGEYEVQILKSDEEFDQFIIWLEDRNRSVIIDPLFTPCDALLNEEFDGLVAPEMVRGFQLGSVEALKSMSERD